MPQQEPKNATVMIVDDEALVCTLVGEILEISGYDVLVVNDATAALTTLNQRNVAGNAVNLLITDVIMPGISGPELVEQALAIAPQLKTIYMSGHTQNRIPEQQIDGICVGYLSKPFSQTELVECVRRMLDRDATIEQG